MNIENSNKQIKLGIILSYINMGIGNLIPIFYTPAMLSLLGQAEYGLYKIASSTTSYLSLISFGIGSAITRYLIKASSEEGKEAEERVLGLFIIIFGVISIIAFIIGCFLSLNLNIWYGKALSEYELNRMAVMVFLMVCNTSLTFILTPYVSIVNTHERFVFLQLMNIFSTCVGPIVNIIVLYLGYASIGMTVSTLCLNVVIRFIYLLYVKKVMQINPKFKDLPLSSVKEILTFSFWIFIANVVGQLYNTTDVVLIGAIPALATTGVAVYSVGSTLSNMIGGVSSALSTILIPKINKMVFNGASGYELTNVAIKVGRIQGIISGLVISGFIAFGKPFIYFYVGNEYENAYWVALFISIPSIIYLVQSTCLSILVAKNKHQFRSIVYLLIAIINVVGTWIVLDDWGIIGAAFVTGAGTVLGHGIFMNWYYKKYTEIEIQRFWKETIKVFWVPIILCMITICLYAVVDFYNIIVLSFAVVFYTLLFIIFCWGFIMNDYEKELGNNLIAKLFRRFNSIK